MRYLNRKKLIYTKRLSIIIVSLLFFVYVVCNGWAQESESQKSNTVIISDYQWSLIVDPLPESIAYTILANKTKFLSLIKELYTTDEELLLLVDKHNPIKNAPFYQPTNLVALSAYPSIKTSHPNHKLTKDSANALEKMCIAAKADGVSLVVSSSYRSYQYQEGILNNYIKEMGEYEAKNKCAPPGCSQHQLGTTVDFAPVDVAFEKTSDFVWLSKHCYKYGYTLSFPKNQVKITGYFYEPWHYRYVGLTASNLIYNYFHNNQHLFLLWWKYFKTVFANSPWL